MRRKLVQIAVSESCDGEDARSWTRTIVALDDRGVGWVLTTQGQEMFDDNEWERLPVLPDLPEEGGS